MSGSDQGRVNIGEIRCAKDDASDADAGGDDSGQYNLI